MKIKKVDDKPMVLHTKQKAKIHTHEPKSGAIKGSNIYTVNRGPKVVKAEVSKAPKRNGAAEYRMKQGKKSYRKSTIHKVDTRESSIARFKRTIKESNASIKTRETNLHIAGRVGASGAKAMTDQMEGGEEIQQAAYMAYDLSRHVIGISSRGAQLFKEKSIQAAKKRIKKVEAGKKLAKAGAKKTAKESAKTVAKESAKTTAKETAKISAKVATKAGAAAAGVAVEKKDTQITNRSRKIKFFLGDVGDALKELTVALDATTEPEKKGIFGIFQKAKRGIDSIKANYAKAETNVSRIEKDLEKHQVVLTQDVEMFEQMYGCFVKQNGIKEFSEEDRLNYMYANMMKVGQNESWYILLQYDEADELQDVNYKKLYIEDIDKEGYDKDKLGKFADILFQNRVVDTLKKQHKKKIYPNDPCPCGSGKKYKKCCGKA